MNRRLQHFLAAEQLSPTQFADCLGIQKSRLSHILSGRNKPGFDFIEKFISTFPNVNIEWFINGTGKMYKEKNSFPTENVPKNDRILADPSADDETFDDLSDDFQEKEGDFSPAELERRHSRPVDNGTNYNGYQRDTPDSKANRLDKNEIFEGISIPGRQNRSISRITVFYSDGSFEEFERRKK